MSILNNKFIFYSVQVKYFAQKGYSPVNVELKIECILKIMDVQSKWIFESKKNLSDRTHEQYIHS